MGEMIVDERDKKDINRQLVFLEMYCIFRLLKEHSNIRDALYKEVLPGIGDGGVNNKFRRMMYGTDIADKAAQKSFREKFGFSNDLCTYQRDLLDYDRSSIDTELLGKYAFYEHNTKADSTNGKRIYTNGVDEKEAEEIKSNCEKYIKEYANKVKNELISGNVQTKKAISETDIGKFIIGIGAATGVEQEFTLGFITRLRKVLQDYEKNRSLITVAALDDASIMKLMTGLEDSIKTLDFDVGALKRILDIKTK